MKKLIYISLILLITATSCDSDYLDTKNLYEKDIDNFYKTPQDIKDAIAGVYHSLFTVSPLSNEHITSNLLSDMMLGGGGAGDQHAKNVDNFLDPAIDTYAELWKVTYNGITRANAIIEKVSEIEFNTFFDSPAEASKFKSETLAEAYFMRAFLYFRAAKFFGGMPLILKINDARDVPRASITDTFAQISSDLKKAIENFPTVNQLNIPTSRYGHANKWVAEAYLGRVYLYYTGYMTNIEGQSTSELPLAEGGSLSKTDVANFLQDCISNSGYQLTPDFRNIWPYSYINEAAGANVFPYATNQNLSWVGQDGHSPTYGTGNNETMFMVRYATSEWGRGGNGQGPKFTNRACLFQGIRDNSTLEPFGQGWGWCTVNPKLWNNWDDADPRKKGSIIEVGDSEQGTQGYEADKGDHETGFFNKKYTPLQFNGPDGLKGLFHYIYDDFDNFQLWHAQDFILMRFADVLLMHSEITETADGLNRVRQRANLAPIAYSLDALKNERVHELSFEGLRWFDLVRWGDVTTAFDASINVRNSGIEQVYKVNYRPETKGLLPIPETEINLSNGKYKQNPGWE
ncbi:RagB/SusD family nutrient uptake outer membrane protein [Polaribacter batillariae]|uniref:RagB/SusD family nutrient uptake outer membrane protein n=1 Tax=Polaribacter batillariae TaxID=2808900 RepID=A0ABX7SYC7_9FLAO|nr:RagB/SusD family nutrient uptake outer membrane protein [Polaribacter batillariae]QTD38498.1 RagB/SusD family nutrient uptake outer membrane protein [Polaribacter batillariae]